MIRRRRRAGSPAHVLILVQNLPVPLDRRVWLECQALREAGYEVSVICPQGPGDAAYEVLEGVHLYKYRPPPQADSIVAYAYEFVYCWIRTALLSVRVARRCPIDVMQTCNPPDTFFLLGWLHRLFGTRFVFDQHDLVPDMFTVKFGRGGLLHRALSTLERLTYRTADHVVTTNGSYAEVAMTRGGVPAERITVVRSGPDHEKLRPVEPDPSLRGGREHLLVWLGVMGAQDGVDVVLRCAADLRDRFRRDDVHVAVLGFGDEYDRLVELAAELDLGGMVTFTGRVGPEEIGRYLSSATIGLVPDPYSSYADLSTHNKTLEYMACALPIVASDLTETRRSAGDAAVYVAPGNPTALAAAVDELLGDPARRAAMGAVGRARIEHELAWKWQRGAYQDTFRRLVAAERVENG